MEIDISQLSPMMQHYMETKKEYPDCILFYRLGDFYEMFFDDALAASKALEITLTGKECGLKERAPMCGVPYHAVDSYLYRLVQKGFKVAIAEQMEDPKQAKGLVKREVIRVVTPGTITSAQALDETKNNYLMGIVYVDGRYGISTADISTGEFLVTEVDSDRELFDEINKFSPSEIIAIHLDTLKAFDTEQLNRYLALDSLFDSEDTSSRSVVKAIASQLLNCLDYSITSELLSDDGMDASVDLNLTSCDFSSVVYSYQEQYTAYLASSQALEDGTEGRQSHAITLLTDCIATSTQTITTPVTIHLNNDGKNWRIPKSDEITTALLGNLEEALTTILTQPES